MAKMSIPDVDLTPEEWQYISILIAHDVGHDKVNNRDVLADKHYQIWVKIQSACQWDRMFLK